jgi:molybdenum transport protein
MQCVLTNEQVAKLLYDDAPYGDLTTDLVVDDGLCGTIEFRARQPMVLSGVEEAARMFELKGLRCEVIVHSSQRVETDTLFLRAAGDAKSLLMVWKMAKVLVEWMSGMATATQRLVLAARDVPVACTRKQTPGTKALSVKAIRNGGGILHRLGLSETVLVFAEHRQFTAACGRELLAKIRNKSPESRAVIEVHNIEDAKYWAEQGADVLQMDKFRPEQVRVISDFCREMGLTTLLSATGGVSAENARDYVEAGAKLLVTSWPYQAPPKDVQVNFTRD